MESRIFWLVDSEQDKPYGTSTYYRCAGIGKFLDKVEEAHIIVGITADDNNIGFILEKKS